jgi:hypothetical protein
MKKKKFFKVYIYGLIFHIWKFHTTTHFFKSRLASGWLGQGLPEVPDRRSTTQRKGFPRHGLSGTGLMTMLRHSWLPLKFGNYWRLTDTFLLLGYRRRKSQRRKKQYWGLLYQRQVRVLYIIDLDQWLLTFFVPWTPKSQNNFHGPLKCYFVLMADPFIPVNKVNVNGYSALLSWSSRTP